MPNWTSCRLEASADVLRKYISPDEDGKPRFDFNLVIPRPEIYNDPEMSSGGDTNDCIYWYLSEKGKTTFTETYRRFAPLFERFFFEPDQGRLIRQCQKHSEEYYRRGKKYVDACKDYGFTTWYDWSCANWGTKWNACDCQVDGSSEGPEWVCFETAWCYPEPVIRKIMEDNPGCLIEFTWYDEDYNGTYTLSRSEDGTLMEDMDWIHDEEEECDNE